MKGKLKSEILEFAKKLTDFTDSDFETWTKHIGKIAIQNRYSDARFIPCDCPSCIRHVTYQNTLEAIEKWELAHNRPIHDD